MEPPTELSEFELEDQAIEDIINLSNKNLKLMQNRELSPTERGLVISGFNAGANFYRKRVLAKLKEIE